MEQLHPTGADPRSERNVTVKLLLSAGARVDYREYNMPLNAASENGHLQIVEALLEAGANVNDATLYHGTAILCATSRGHEDVVARLIAAGANVNKGINQRP
jgi:uncharacterized protein